MPPAARQIYKRLSVNQKLALLAELEAKQRRKDEAATDGTEDITLREFCLGKGTPEDMGAWGVLEPATPFVGGWHIDAIIAHLQGVADGELQSLIINVPPGSMKSLLVSAMFPAWLWIKQPHRRLLTGSYVLPLATRDSLKSRTLIESPWYQGQWGHVYSLRPDQNQKTRYENNKTGFRIAISVGGGLGERGDRILDDPHSVKGVISEKQRMTDIEWIGQTWALRAAEVSKSFEVVVMQRLHERDVSGYYLEEIGGYEHLVIPMRFEPKRSYSTSLTPKTDWGNQDFSKDPRTEAGQLMCPERFDMADVALLERGLGSYGTAGQMQQNPAPRGGGIVKRIWWRYWKPAGLNLPPVQVSVTNEDGTIDVIEIEAVDLPSQFNRHHQSWDMSFKGGKHNSFVVGQAWSQYQADCYLIDQVRGRWDFTKTLKEFRAFAERYTIHKRKYVEDKANGPAVISSLRSEISGIVPVNPQGSKEARVHSVTPKMESGNVYVPHPMIYDWVEGFLGEHDIFPNGDNDDQVDACSQSLDRFPDIAGVRMG